MRSTLTRSLTAVVAGAALTAGAAGLAFADSHDFAVPHTSEANQAAFWEAYLADNHDIADATCFKIDGGGTPFTVPAQPTDAAWVLAVIKAGAGAEANWGFLNPEAGDKISHTKETSHVILCSAPVEDEPTPTPTDEPTPTPTPTEEPTPKPTPSDEPTPKPTDKPTTKPTPGPVVETDIPGGGNQTGLIAGALALAGAGAYTLARRRGAQH